MELKEAFSKAPDSANLGRYLNAHAGVLWLRGAATRTTGGPRGEERFFDFVSRPEILRRDFQRNSGHSAQNDREPRPAPFGGDSVYS